MSSERQTGENLRASAMLTIMLLITVWALYTVIHSAPALARAPRVINGAPVQLIPFH